jgi:hypothetical protein
MDGWDVHEKRFCGLINYRSTLLSFDTNYIICKESRKLFLRNFLNIYVFCEIK